MAATKGKWRKRALNLQGREGTVGARGRGVGTGSPDSESGVSDEVANTQERGCKEPINAAANAQERSGKERRREAAKGPGARVASGSDEKNEREREERGRKRYGIYIYIYKDIQR